MTIEELLEKKKANIEAMATASRERDKTRVRKEIDEYHRLNAEWEKIENAGTPEVHKKVDEFLKSGDSIP